jgi:hypothetical protein
LLSHLLHLRFPRLGGGFGSGSELFLQRANVVSGVALGATFGCQGKVGPCGKYSPARK